MSEARFAVLECPSCGPSTSLIADSPIDTSSLKATFTDGYDDKLLPRPVSRSFFALCRRCGRVSSSRTARVVATFETLEQATRLHPNASVAAMLGARDFASHVRHATRTLPSRDDEKAFRIQAWHAMNHDVRFGNATLSESGCAIGCAAMVLGPAIVFAFATAKGLAGRLWPIALLITLALVVFGAPMFAGAVTEVASFVRARKLHRKLRIRPKIAPNHESYRHAPISPLDRVAPLDDYAANLTRLYDLLDEHAPRERLLKAEVARALGQFDEAIALAESTDVRDEDAAWAKTVARLARQRNRLVARLE